MGRAYRRIQGGQALATLDRIWPGELIFRQDTFTESNYRLFFGLALDVILKPWEKAVLSLKYTEVLLIVQFPEYF